MQEIKNLTSVQGGIIGDDYQGW